MDDLKLSIAEERLLECAKLGIDCVLGSGDPSKGASWDLRRALRAEVVVALCTGEKGWPVHPRGVQVSGAKISGELNFTDREVPLPLGLERCFVPEPVSLSRCDLTSVTISKCWMHSLQATQMAVKHNVFLTESSVTSGVYPLSAEIGGDFNLNGSRIEGPNAMAVVADGLQCRGGVILGDGFQANGMVRLTGASVGRLACRGATFSNPGGDSLCVDGLRCRGTVSLVQVSSHGEFRLAGAQLGGQLVVVDCSFENPGGEALNAEGVRCRGDVMLSSDFSAQGTVNFMSAEVQRNFDCSGATLSAPNGDALIADGLRAEIVELGSGFSAQGQVRFVGARVRALQCTDGTFDGNGGCALLAPQLKCETGITLAGNFRAIGEVQLGDSVVSGSVDLRGGQFEARQSEFAIDAHGLSCRGRMYLGGGFKATGTVKILRATIDGGLDCRGGRFESVGGHALIADGLSCRGDVLLSEGFVAVGQVRLVGGSVSGALQLKDGEIKNEGDCALLLIGSRFERALFLIGKIDGGLNLAAVRTQHFEWLRESWPTETTELGGFEYTTFDGSELSESIAWLNRAEFSGHAYEVMAAAYRSSGETGAATKVLMARESRRVRGCGESLGSRTLLWLKGVTIGYGYRPMRAVLLLVILEGIGTTVFYFNQRIGHIVPRDLVSRGATGEKATGSVDYRSFHPLVYSLDTLIPVVDLGMESRWEPLRAKSTVVGRAPWEWGWWYLRLHVLLGWLFTTLSILGFTGLVRPE